MSYIQNKLEDIQYGKKREKQLLPIINDFFDCNLLPYKNKFSVVDFYDPNEEIYVELKSRKIPSDNFYKLMIGKNKIDFFKEKLQYGKRCVIIFDYTDYLYSLELNLDMLKDFSYKQWTRTDRDKNETSMYCFIEKHKFNIIATWLYDIDEIVLV